MTSNRTPNFGLPMYAANDITSWLVDFNGAMTDIDTSLKAIKTVSDQANTAATGASGSVAEINQTLVNIQNTLSNLTSKVNAAGRWVSMPATTSTIAYVNMSCHVNVALKLVNIYGFITPSQEITRDTVITTFQGLRPTTTRLIRCGVTYATTNNEPVKITNFHINTSGGVYLDTTIAVGQTALFQTMLNASEWGLTE